MLNKSFRIYTLGCKVNQYDGGELAAKLASAGFVAAKKDADLVIVNTCAVTKKALAKDRQMVARAQRENPGARIVVAGCAPRVYKEEMAELRADLVVEDREADEIVAKISNIQFPISNKISNQKKVSSFKFQVSRSDTKGVGCLHSKQAQKNKSRYFLKIQDGCRQFCSYCIIPYARGELASRPMDEVTLEVERAVAAGHKEIVLCGIHLGLYGQELKVKSAKLKVDLVALLKELIKIKNLGRIRLSSIEVNEVTGELIDLIERSGKICRHLHIPLQSGCDKILKLMNRPYTTEMFADKVKKIRRAIPSIALTTDVIVGFPGESEADFKATAAFIKKLKFSKVHVFPFSAHERTPAAKMPGQVAENVKLERSRKLNALSVRLEKAYRRKFSGKKLSVIIDGHSKDNRYRGKSEYYFDIRFRDSHKYDSGDLVEVKDWRLP